MRNCLCLLAEAVRFELTNGCPLLVFKTSAIDHSATLPFWECAKNPLNGTSNGTKRNTVTHCFYCNNHMLKALNAQAFKTGALNRSATLLGCAGIDSP